METIIKRSKVIELNGESCSWCRRRDACTNNKNDMEQTRATLISIDRLTHAYCRIKVNCDYYLVDEIEYYNLNPAEFQKFKSVRAK